MKGMKTIILAMVLATVSCVCNGQNREPQAVAKAFAQMYPDSKVREWTEEGVNLWMVTFKDKDDRTRDMAYFKSNGEWVKTETKIPIVRDLPINVAMGWKRTDFSDWLVEDMKEVKYPDRNVYVMKVEQGCGPDVYVMPGNCAEAYNLYFSKNGALLKQTLAKNDDFDDVSGVDFR
jgi:hypothetical protein